MLRGALSRRTIERELAQSLEETFSYVNPVPMATASVAQVHEATLRTSNKEVVIKVLKPGVEDVLTTDLSFLVRARAQAAGSAPYDS